MELDHVFVFTKEPEQVASSLRAFGLTEGTPNSHPGQGTACRRFFFHNAYLELAWVSDEEEVKNPAIANMKLWERSQHQLTNYCPVGLCFRSQNRPGNSINVLFENGWRYYSAFLPEGQFANIAANGNFPAEPMLFEMPFFGKAPKDYPPEKQQPLTHERGFVEITKVTLTLPTTANYLSDSMKAVILNSTVAIVEGKAFSIRLEFDHARNGETKEFNYTIPLIIDW